jgi:uncharacterized protein
MKQLIGLFALLVFMILAAAWLSKPGNSDLISSKINQTSAPQSSSSLTKSTMKVGNTTLNVEVAKTESTRRTGLSEHSKLDSDSGMLFVFDQKDFTPDFWMKGMQFPIDIIWINENKVTQINKKVPVPLPTVADSDLPRYRPTQPIDYVLEVASGVADDKGIKVGDKVELPSGI